MANREGKQQAITTISPMKALNTFKLSFFFFIRSLGLAMGEAKKLKQLSFIHFARWAIIKRDAFPHLGASSIKMFRYSAITSNSKAQGIQVARN